MKPTYEYLVAALRAIGYHKRPRSTWDSPQGLIRVTFGMSSEAHTIATEGREQPLIECPYGVALYLLGEEILEQGRKPKDREAGQRRFLKWLDQARRYDLGEFRW